MAQKLKVWTADQAMVPDYKAMDARIKRFVNRRFDANLGDPVFMNGEYKYPGGWIKLEEPSEVDARAEYLFDLKCGDLIPADKATAEYAGLPWSEKKSTK